MAAILKALAVIAGLVITFASYMWVPGKGLWPHGEKVTRSDWILIGIVLGALFLVLVYAFRVKVGA